MAKLDGIELEILWSNLISIVSEQARALQRIAFSPIVREAGDLATALFDSDARMVAQAITGTPGHINSLGAAAGNLVDIIPPEELNPGDVLITNDPWMSAGHFFDITLLTPIFRKKKLIGYCGSTIHHTDIGGYGVDTRLVGRYVIIWQKHADEKWQVGRIIWNGTYEPEQ